jgi:UDP-glucose 4-epimerase
LYSSAEAVRDFVETTRLRDVVGNSTAYRYERDVEQFFRHSPAVVRTKPSED